MKIFIGLIYYMLYGVGLILLLIFAYILKNLIYRFNIKPEDLYGKHLNSLFFLPFSKFPVDKDLFLKIKSLGSNALPKLDLNDYILDGVDFSHVKFNKNTILPKDLNFMQKIQNKDLSCCTMPIGDYSKYNFKDVFLYKTKFPEGCILPADYNFFINLDSKSLVTEKSIPKDFLKKIHLYNLDKRVRINKASLSIKQNVYLKLRYLKYYKQIVDIDDAQHDNIFLGFFLYSEIGFYIDIIFFTIIIFYFVGVKLGKI